jgi:acyl-CoA reductase-like NAD-dependent aldehyde dehydrogenase
MSKLISRSPTTGAVIQEIEMTDPSQLPGIFERARSAQKGWSATPASERAKLLLNLRETLLNHADEIVDLISNENGKPRLEALVNELVASVDTLTYFAKKGPKLLKDRPIKLQLMKHRKSIINYWPLGTVLLITPWNYPFLLPFADLVMALMAGNSVIFKPSEVTPVCGLKIQELCNLAGIPAGVVQTVIGDGTLGAACIEQKPNKIFFTGSPQTGRKIMAAAANHLIPVNLELGGKDAMIVMPDADLDFATSAALWGGFSNSGQICASVERVIIHDTIKEPFLEILKKKVEKLRIGPSDQGQNDLGAITLEKQKAIYIRHLEQARSKNAEFISGGNLSGDKKYLSPTIISGTEIESLDVYQEETFGPVLAVTSFKQTEEAIRKTNQSKYGLLASIITQDIKQGEQIAKKLDVGTVTINEVTYTGGLGETPWGGVKESGFGKTHSDVGLYEFVNMRHIHGPKAQFMTFKSLWWFPYTRHQYLAFRFFLELYRKSWWLKLRTLPKFLTNFMKFILFEKRL